MYIQSSFITNRLLIKPITVNNNKFILELVNTEGWLRFIGDRNITNPAEATNYIQKIIDNQNISYWAVNLKNTKQAIGIITFIQRDYLDHPDIGFAFLPTFCKKGYAYEATITVLNNLISTHSPILATTIPENINSIQLLKKIGFTFDKEIETEKEKLHVYIFNPLK